MNPFERTSSQLARQYGRFTERKTRGPNGRPCCRWCGQEIPKGRRRTFCSDDCVHEFKLRTQTGYVRDCVRKRDQGVCALCGLDCHKLHRVLVAAFQCLDPRPAVPRFDYCMSPADRQTYNLAAAAARVYDDRYRVAKWAHQRTEAQRAIDDVAIRLGFVQRNRRMLGTWELEGGFYAIDHTVPVVEGGGLCGMDGYRTLCHRCHAQETKALAARRAKLRAAAQEIREHGIGYYYEGQDFSQMRHWLEYARQNRCAGDGYIVVASADLQYAVMHLGALKDLLVDGKVLGMPLRFEPLRGRYLAVVHTQQLGHQYGVFVAQNERT